MQAIWKFQLVTVDRQYVAMPEGARILSADVQNGQICLWAIVDPDKPREFRQVIIAGTGNPLDLPAGFSFVATVQMPPFVWHVFVEGGDDAAP